jgi:hypothetical protein
MNNSPLYGYNTTYLSIDLLKSILVAATFDGYE